ncbi:MAG: M16 family metallopeptidase [Candidatus Dormibacteria bacterium]
MALATAQPTYRLTRTPGGARVIVAPMRERASVSLSLMVAAGSRHEPAERAGIAHFLEHIVFKGGHRYPSARLVSEAVESVGGSLNAATDEETTTFWAKVPEAHLQLAAGVLADIVFSPVLEEAEVVKERGVVIEELRMYRDSPSDHVNTLFDEVMWPGHAFGRDVAGTEATVATFTAADCRDFLRQGYGARNLVVSIAGAVDENQAAAAVAEMLDTAWGDGGRPDPGPVPAAAAAERLRFEGRRTQQVNLMLGCRAGGYADDDRYAVDVLNTVLGEGMASRLFLEVRERLCLAYEVHSFAIKHSDTGALAIFVGCEPKRVEAAVVAVRSELQRLVREPVADDELRRAQAAMTGRLSLQLESTSALASYLGEQELLTDEILTPEEVARRIDAVTAADLQRVARRLCADGLRAAAIGPLRRPERLIALLGEPLL